jgi:hypothetical protein
VLPTSDVRVVVVAGNILACNVDYKHKKTRQPTSRTWHVCLQITFIVKEVRNVSEIGSVHRRITDTKL